MSRFFGEIRQVAYLVPDIEAAMDYWANVLGVGPWFYNPRVPIENRRHRRGVNPNTDHAFLQFESQPPLESRQRARLRRWASSCVTAQA